MALRGIILDFDGVIADTEPLHFRAFRDVLAAEGIDLKESAYYARYIGLSDTGSFQEIASDSGRSWVDSRIAALVARKAARFAELERDAAVVFPGADAFVRSAAAVFPLAIASGALRAEIIRVLEASDLGRCFQVIISAEDVASSKPAPDAYVRAVERLSDRIGDVLSPAECVAIEDSEKGLESARAAGLRTVAIRHTYNAESVLGADLIVAGLAALNVTDLLDLMSQ